MHDNGSTDRTPLQDMKDVQQFQQPETEKEQDAEEEEEGWFAALVTEARMYAQRAAEELEKARENALQELEKARQKAQEELERAKLKAQEELEKAKAQAEDEMMKEEGMEVNEDEGNAASGEVMAMRVCIEDMIGSATAS